MDSSVITYQINASDLQNYKIGLLYLIILIILHYIVVIMKHIDNNKIKKEKLKKELEPDINRLYNLRVITNIVSWNFKINPNKEYYLVQKEALKNYYLSRREFIKKYPKIDFAIELNKMVEIQSYYSKEADINMLELVLHQKYLNLKRTKSNADEEYYVALENLIEQYKKILIDKKITYIEFNDKKMGDEKLIKYIIERMANISIRKLFNDTHTNNKDIKYLKTKEISQKEIIEYINTFENINVFYSPHINSFAMKITENLTNINININENEYQKEKEMAYAIAHEIGHAEYQTKILNKKLKLGKFDEELALSLHESSSILNEIACVGLDYKISTNKALYRLGSNKLYYVIHIYIRMKIEDMIFNHNLNVRDITKVWNQMVEEYIHLVPQNDFEGFLQDAHWNQGLFGYFQSYGIGFFNAINMLQTLNINEEMSLSEITKLVMEKIENTYGKYNAASNDILNDMYPNIEEAIDKYEEFINNNFYHEKG